MSRSLSHTRRLALSTAVTTTLIGGLIVLTPAAASAEPRPRDTACSVLLQRAVAWPGSVSTPQGEVRYVSDAFHSYLLRQPECAATGG